MATVVVLNIIFEGGSRDGAGEILKVDRETKWMDLEAMLKVQYECESMAVKYIDQDGDYISLNSQEELLESFKVASHNFSNTLHLVLRDIGSEVDSPDTEEKEETLVKEPPTQVEFPPLVYPHPTNKSDDDKKAIGDIECDIVPIMPLDKKTEKPPVTKGTGGVKRKHKGDTSQVDKATGEILELEMTDIVGHCTIKPLKKEKTTLVAETGESQGDDFTKALTAVSNAKEQKMKHISSQDKPLLLNEGLKLPVDFKDNVKEPIKVEINKEFTGKDRKKKSSRIEKKKIEETKTKHEDKGARPKRTSHDKDSGEMAPDEVAMPYSVFVKFMQQLKSDLRSEIVKDVTRKTVRHVLKGLDGAVIVPGQTDNAAPAITKPLGKLPADGSCDPESNHPMYFHEGINCSFCERVIMGVRYKCCNCNNYDLCEECEGIYGIHDVDHIFIKIRKPCSKLPRSKPLFKTTIYRVGKTKGTATVEKPAASKEEKEESAASVKMPDQLDYEFKMKKLKKRAAKHQEKLKKKEQKLLQKYKKRSLLTKGDTSVSSKESETSENSSTSQNESSAVKDTDIDVMEHFSAEFVCDVNIPDGTTMIPGSKIIRTWSMRNNGLLAWNSLTTVQMIHSSFPSDDHTINTVVPPLIPGEEGNVTVEMRAPDEPGDYACNWRLQNGDHVTFGPHLWLQIRVESPVVEIVTNVKDQSEYEPVESSTETTVDEVLVTKTENIQLTSDPTDKESDCEITDAVIVHLEDEEPSKTAKDGDNLLTLGIEPMTTPLMCEKQAEKSDDLNSYDLLDMATEEEKVHKVSQTATPNNTPMVFTPPKTPAGETEDFCGDSSSSVEVVTVDDGTDTERGVNMGSQYMQDVLSKLQAPKLVEDLDVGDVDLESLQSYNSDDSSSMSEDEDFLIVPMPACFDFTKPISDSVLDSLSDDTDSEEEEDTHYHLPREAVTEKTVDDILTTSENINTPPLSPEPVDNSSATEKQEKAVVQINIEAAGTVEDLTFDPEETAVMTVVPSAGAAVGCHDTPDVSRVQSDEIFGHGNTAEEPCDQSEATDSAGASNPESTDTEDGGTEEGGATAAPQGQSSRNNRPSDLFVNQMMATAVKAANKAASNAYTTAKEVFYTWQARGYQNGRPKHSSQTNENASDDHKASNDQWKPSEEQWTPDADQQQWKPIGNSWKPVAEKYKPPSSSWKPDQKQWKPKADTWTPPKPNCQPKNEKVDAEKFKQLLEMGFCNKEQNEYLLVKHDNHLEDVIQDIVNNTGNDWMNSRH